MKVLVTGAGGFLGRNLVAELQNRGFEDILEYDVDTGESLLEEYARECGFVFHLAGVNRPSDEKEFMKGNCGFTRHLLGLLEKHSNTVPFLFSSSIQAELGNPYGLSKRAAEEVVLDYGRKSGVPVYIYRLANLFGKWSRPNYNTVVATYCHNIARGLDIQINNPDAELHLCYVDDVVEEFLRALDAAPTRKGGYCAVSVSYRIKLGELAEKIRGFSECRGNLSVPDMSDSFTRKLYATYLSFLPEDGFSYPLKMNADNRGSFTEFLRTPERGQVSINVAKPGITKGNHWHHTKNEKFLVVKGEAVIRFRKVGSREVFEYRVSGKKLEAMDIPVGYTHSITNTGDTDLVTVMWASEPFDPDKPDTYFMEV